MPVSISLGLWSTLLVYLDLASRSASPRRCATAAAFDVATSAVVLVGYAIPGFLFAILLVVLFAGGSFVQWFPLRGLTSEGAAPGPGRRGSLDYAWHMVLPTMALVAGGFASLTILTKNCFLEEIRKQYVVTARAKGAGEQRVLYGHVFRNAMLLIVAGFPAAFIGILFSSRAAGRDRVLARRARPARLRERDPARLPGDVRHALHLHPARPGACRSSATCSTPWSIRASTSRRAVMRISPLTRRRLAHLPRASARLLVAVDLPRPVRALPVRRVHRQRPAAAGPLRRPLLRPGAAATTARTRSAPTCCRPRPTTPTPTLQTRDQRAWLDALAADPVQLRHHRQGPAQPGAVAALLAQPARHRRPGARRAGPRDLRLPHLRAVRLHADRRLLGRSASPPARCRASTAA